MGGTSIGSSGNGNGNGNGNGRAYSAGRSLTGGSRSDTYTLERQDTVLTIGMFKLRGKTDDLPQCVPFSPYFK
jgi:hypothetical protein